ncbi:MAG: hypothetical protein SGJ02_12745 [bacterium]|nr:hypothetical protein [bacterium]
MKISELKAMSAKEALKKILRMSLHETIKAKKKADSELEKKASKS